MTTLSIQTNASPSTIQAIKDLIYSIDPEAFIEDENANLSKEDAKDLKEILAKRKRGELEFISLEEMKQRSKEYLQSLGAKI